MAKIGKPQRIITTEPLVVPEHEPEPVFEPIIEPEREKEPV